MSKFYLFLVLNCWVEDEVSNPALFLEVTLK